jgi:glucose dehydrogenase
LRLRPIALFALAAAGAGCRGQPAVAPSTRVGSVTGVAGAPANVRLVSAPPNGEWTIPGGDYGHARFSPLDQIGVGNVGQLKVATTFSTGIPQGHEGGRSS